MAYDLAGMPATTPTRSATGVPPGLDRWIEQYATEYGVPADLARRVMRQESGGDSRAVSAKGAIGPMQLMPETAKGLGVDPYDPEANIRGGIRYLKQQLDRFGGDTRLALAAYNAGPGAVARYGGVPPYAETQAYVTAVTGEGGGTPSRYDLSRMPRYDLSAMPKAATSEVIPESSIGRPRPVMRLNGRTLPQPPRPSATPQEMSSHQPTTGAPKPAPKPQEYFDPGTGTFQPAPMGNLGAVPLEGARQIGKGMAKGAEAGVVIRGGPLGRSEIGNRRQAMSAASDVLEGTGKVLSPLVALGLVEAPVATALTLALSAGSADAAQQVTALLGGGPEAQRFAADLAATAVALKGGGKTLKGIRQNVDVGAERIGNLIGRAYRLAKARKAQGTTPTLDTPVIDVKAEPSPTMRIVARREPPQAPPVERPAPVTEPAPAPAPEPSLALVARDGQTVAEPPRPPVVEPPPADLPVPEEGEATPERIAMNELTARIRPPKAPGQVVPFQRREVAPEVASEAVETTPEPSATLPDVVTPSRGAGNNSTPQNPPKPEGGRQAADLPAFTRISGAFEIAKTEAAKEPAQRYFLRFDAKQYRPGDKLPPSRKWNDGQPTKRVYKGTSVIDLRGNPLRDPWGRPIDGSYEGDAYLVTGRVTGRGQDAAEVFVQDATVVRKIGRNVVPGLEADPELADSSGSPSVGEPPSSSVSIPPDPAPVPSPKSAEGAKAKFAAKKAPGAKLLVEINGKPTSAKFVSENPDGTLVVKTRTGQWTVERSQVRSGLARIPSQAHITGGGTGDAAVSASVPRADRAVGEPASGEGSDAGAGDSQGVEDVRLHEPVRDDEGDRHFTAAVERARAAGFDGDVTTLRPLWDRALADAQSIAADLADDRASLDEEFGYRGLFSLIAEAGGIPHPKVEKTYPEIAQAFWEASTGTTDLGRGKGGKSRKLKYHPTGAIGGVSKVTNTKGPQLEDILKHVQESGRYPDIERIQDLEDALGRFVERERHPVQSSRQSVTAASLIPDDWWIPQDATDFNPEAFGEAPVIDQIEAGAQPRLPGEVGAVREREIATPEFEVPFSLEREAVRRKAVQPSLLGK